MRALRILSSGFFRAVRSIRRPSVFGLMLALAVSLGLLGVASSLSAGTHEFARQLTARWGPRMMFVQNWSVRADGGRVFDLDISEVQRVRSSLAGVAQVGAQLSWAALTGDSPTVSTENGVSRRVDVCGVECGFISVRDSEVIEGSEFNLSDDRAGAMVCVLGHRIATDLFGASSAVGKRIRVESSVFDVVGVIRARQLQSSDFTVFIPIGTAMRRIHHTRVLTGLYVTVADSADLEPVAARVKQVLEAPNRDGTQTRKEIKVYLGKQMATNYLKSSGMFRKVAYAISYISLFACAAMMCVAMLFSIRQRVGEIGLRRALGATSLDVFLHFMGEALALCLISLSLGSAVVVVTVRLMSDLQQRYPLSLTPGVWVMLSASAICAAFVGGFLPALEAARANPAEALR